MNQPQPAPPQPPQQPPTADNNNNNSKTPEDDRGEEGASIATFSEYQPTALCSAIVQACNQSSKQVIVIDVEEDEDKKKNTDSIYNNNNVNDGVETTNQTTFRLTIPSHTSKASESNLLSSVSAPTVDIDSATCILPLLQTGKLSPLQAEGVLLALQRHRRMLHGHTRGGFFLGDGAGIGKGRQIGAIVRDSLCRSNIVQRHLWLSVSSELIVDARRDLTDVGVHVDVHNGATLLNSTKGLGKQAKGVLFLTYNLLVSNNRLEQLVEWCAGTAPYKKSSKNAPRVLELEQAFDGCIVYDEAHKAKNLANDTKTAKLVLELQRRLPRARVIYCSATGVSDASHLAYAERLGLWNTGGGSRANTHFENFGQFQKSLEKRGLGALELLALELKQQGMFMARTLSWEGAEFETQQVPLNKEQKVVYDQAVQWWTTCQASIVQANVVLESSSKLIWPTFWSAHQRFFKELAICAKVPYLCRDALQQVQQGRCVVIGLQSTGEAGMQSLLETYGHIEDEKFPALLSTLQATLKNFVVKNFPVTSKPLEAPKLPDAPPSTEEETQQYLRIKAEIDRIAALPAPKPNPVLMKLRQTLLDAIETLDLPPNPLDHITDLLGGADCVAEMTGRSGRMVRKAKNQGHCFVYAKRLSPTTSAASAQDDSNRINLVERRLFMDGKKPFAIISDAASTGISLHAARGSGAANKQRVMYTIELPWAADKAVQQLGRTHRSGQDSAPIYKLVVTELGGEVRFAAAVSKRLSRLGALTKGDRRAATGSDMLSLFDLDSKYGKRALKRFYAALAENQLLRGQQNDDHVLPPQCLPAVNTKSILEGFVEQLVENQDPEAASIPAENDAMKHSTVLAFATQALQDVGLDEEARAKSDIRVFLNRLAGVKVMRQTLVFSLFMATFEDVMKEAKSTGEFEGTAEDLKATSIELLKEEDLAVDPSCGAKTKLTTLSLDRGVSFETACNMAVEEASKSSSCPNKKVYVEDNFENSEDDGDVDEWMSNTETKDTIAPSGFYISRKLIAGRNLILFAKQQFDRSEFESEEQAANFDAEGLMVITRPNTGTNLTEMSSRDLNYKYRLAWSCEQLAESKQKLSAADKDSVPTVAVVEQESREVARLWKEAHSNSNQYKHHKGLAPRLAKVALVTGPVLHILPAMEKAVKFRQEQTRALKIMRAQVGARRIVGARFPADEEAVESLRQEIEKLLKARKTAGNSFVDEPLPPICNKRLEWCTTERKTMKSFFQVVSTKKSTPVAKKNAKNSTSDTAMNPLTKKGGIKNGKASVPGKRKPTSTMSVASKKKAKAGISSFFEAARKSG